MIYDVLIIGGGPAGLTCGIHCAENGLRTVIITGGMNSLHFASGSVDVLGYDSKGKEIENPFKALPALKKEKPDHPYNNVGAGELKKALAFFQKSCKKGGLILDSNGEKNHPHLTALGVLKPSFLSQPTVFNERLREAFLQKVPMRLLNFEGFRDYYAEMAIDVMKRDPRWDGCEITTGTINMPYYADDGKNLHEFRSMDLARIFDTERYLPRIAEEIKKAGGEARVVSLPAFMGIANYEAVHRRLEEMTGCIIYEIPTLPPSITGLRIDKALKNRFAELGGEFSIGDNVTSSTVEGNEVKEIHTKNYGTRGHAANFFVLATGSFFSNGLKSDFATVTEPIFNLAVKTPGKRNSWYHEEFFSPKSHPFMEIGVITDKNFNAVSSGGSVLKNLFAAGSVLGGYNPVREGSGGGVAIATGYQTAERIIKLSGKKS